MTIELIIIGLYFVLLIVVGWLGKRLARTSTDFLIAGRNLGVVLCTVSIAGEWIGGMSTVGTAEIAYSHGFFPAWYNISTAIGMMLFGFSLASVYRKHNVHTVGEMLEKIYNKEVRIITSICFAVAFLILAYLQLQTVGSIAAQVMKVDYSQAVIISGILITLYVYFGGMHSIVLTNMVHFILLYSVLITVFILVMIKVGGYSGLFENLEKVIGANGVKTFQNPFSLGIGKAVSWLVGGILAGFASQASIQPVFAAKDINTAKRSAIRSALLIAPIGILVSTMAMAARTGLFGGQPPSVKETLPYLMVNGNFLPSWLGGLAIAAILAAVLTTFAPVVFAASTILTKDIYQRVINPNASDNRILSVSTFLVVSIGLLSIPLAIFLKGAILDTAYITYAIRASAAIVVLLGVYRVKKWIPSPTPRSVSAAMITASIASVVFVIYEKQIAQLLGFAVDKVYAAVFFTLVTIVVFLSKKRV